MAYKLLTLLKQSNSDLKLRNKKYIEIILDMEKNISSFLKDYDYYNLKLALKYLDIVERDQMPVIIDKEHKTYESAIDDNDFESALSIHMHTSKIQKVDPRESMRYPLLVRIIDKLNEKNKVKIR